MRSRQCSRTPRPQARGGAPRDAKRANRSSSARSRASARAEPHAGLQPQARHLETARGARGADLGAPDEARALEQREHVVAVAGQRCLIPATGFYEWQDAGERTRQPWTIEPLNDDFFTFGGLWEVSRRPDDVPVLSFTIVTVPINPLVAGIHNGGRNEHRMPLIVGESVLATA